MMKENETKVCPICGLAYNDVPAISRKDNKTEICPNCGLSEAITDFCNFMETHKNPIKGGE